MSDVSIGSSSIALEDSEPTSTEAPKPRSFLRRLARNLERALALTGLSIILYHYCLHSSRVVSPSMQPTLQGTNYEDGDRILTEKLSYLFRKPQRWEVIAFRRDSGEINMKRVAAFPGETISMKLDGTVVINGKPVPLPESLSHLQYFPIAKLYPGREVKCEDGYFVLGDDSRDSDDSRYEELVRPDRVIGRAWLILSPANRLGFVNSSY